MTVHDVAPGNATVSNVSFPSTVTLTHEGDGIYVYSARPVQVTFESITGGDVQVTYGIQVPDLGLSRARTSITDGANGTDLTMQLGTYVEGDLPNASQYDGTVYLSMISEGENRLVARSNVTVMVVDDV